MKKIIFLLALIMTVNSLYSQLQAPKHEHDAFLEMMKILNISEDNLGYSPKGYWSRYPVPDGIPYKIVSFNDMMAEPHKIHDFIRTMALSVDESLNPDYLEKNTNGLLQVAFYCGIQHLTSEMRCYNASLFAEVDSTEPMLKAIKEIYTFTHTEWKYNRFGKAADFPLIEDNLRKAISAIHPEIRKAIAPTIIHLLHAYKFREIGMRNVDYKDAVDTWRVRLMGETQFDGMEYYPQIEDCAKNIDMNSIYYAGYKLLETSEVLSKALLKLKKEAKGIDWREQNLNIVTPIGRIVISGSGDDVHQYNDAVLVVELGGDDTYKGSAGSTPSLNQGISLLIDLDGNDKYINDDEYLPSQGSAIFGAAMLMDVSGNDIYESKRLSQGASMFGIGILVDMEGNDKYNMLTSGQGGAYFGIGLAIDNQGDDEYRLWGDGQGYGGVGGAGTLINRTGNDYYYAEFDSKKVHRPDMDHSKNGQHNYTYCQGSGVGRRGDITDGHSWAGGIGTLIDLEGDDEYISGNWSQGCGYWYGMGFLWDGKGNDKYRSTSWSMASGAHFCISGLFDEAGDDDFEIWYEQGVGMGFGHDFTVTYFLNRGGNDKYKLQENGFGYAINTSQVFFFDTDGNDTYITGSKGHNFGWNNFTQHNPPELSSMYLLYADQIALFGDLGGMDKYINIDLETCNEKPDERLKDNGQIFYPTATERDSLANKRHYGLGKDFDNWTLPEIEYFRDKMRR
ncbi:MAG: hypothetical protein V1779_03285 [bacterium]